jgi:hypothetical protein
MAPSVKELTEKFAAIATQQVPASPPQNRRATAVATILDTSNGPTGAYQSMTQVLASGGFAPSTVLAVNNGYLKMGDARANARSGPANPQANAQANAPANAQNPAPSPAQLRANAGYGVTRPAVRQPPARVDAPGYGPARSVAPPPANNGQPQGGGNANMVAPQPPGNQGGARHRPVEMLPAAPVKIQPAYQRVDEANIDFKQVDPGELWARFGVPIAARLTRRGALLDTGEIRRAYDAKCKRRFFGPRHKWEIAKPGLGVGRNNQALYAPSLAWYDDTLIWVAVAGVGTAEPSFYTNIPKMDRFHHSSFTWGGDLIGAGEWIVRKGELVAVSANSGHYRPPTSALQASMRALRPAITRNTVVMLYDRQAEQYAEVPAMDFLIHGTHQGRYKAHKDGM